jgi:hypothetical protein
MILTQFSQTPVWLAIAPDVLLLVLFVGPSVARWMRIRPVPSVPTQAPPPPAGGDPAYPPLSRKRRFF